MVRLETKLALKRRFDFTLISTRAGEEGTAELYFDEDLGVELAWSRVEGGSWDRLVHVVGCSDRVAVFSNMSVRKRTTISVYAA